MQDERTKGGGWFKVEHGAMDAIVERCAPKHTHYVIAGYLALLKLGNLRRPAMTFEATRQEVAKLGGMSVDTLDRVVVPALAQLGLATHMPGVRGGANRWTLAPQDGRWERQGPPEGGRCEPEGVPLRAAGGAADSGSTRAQPRDEDVEDEKRDAPDGARPPSPMDDPVTERAAAIAVRHSELVAAQAGTKPRSRALTAKERAAVLDLAGQLDADDWPQQLDLAMRVGLAGTDFMRGRAVTLPGLAEYLQELLAKAKRSDTGPPPAAWDASDAYDASGDEGLRCANCGEVKCPSARACALQVEHAASLASSPAVTVPAELPPDAKYADNAPPDDDIPF